MKKCKNCGAPLEGFLYKTIGKLMGIKPSEKDQELCNKCEADMAKKEEMPEEKIEVMSETVTEPMEKESQQEAEPMVSESEEKSESMAESEMPKSEETQAETSSEEEEKKEESNV